MDSSSYATRPRVLFVGDFGPGADLSREPFMAAGFEPHETQNPDEALEAVRRLRPALVLVPAMLAHDPAEEMIARGLETAPGTKFVVVAAAGQITEAARAMRAGAFECLFVPFTRTALTRLAETALRGLPPAQPAAGGVTTPVAAAPGLDPAVAEQTGLIGHGPAMQGVLRLIASVARSNATVFIGGETGTGKALAARAIHLSSPRANGPFVAVDCGRLAAKTLDLRFHGGGEDGNEGILAEAGGGSLFLDEICDLDPHVQVRFLRLIEEMVPEADLGERPAQGVQRIICSTARDPGEEIRAGRLRPDLYYRLCVAPIHMPPLRERIEDIGHIALAKLAQFSRSEGGAFAGISPEALGLLEAHSWPGNVRQLVNVIRRIVLSHRGETVEAHMLPEEFHTPAPPPVRVSSASPSPGRPFAGQFAGLTLAEIERMAIEAAIEAEAGSVPRAARVLDVAPSTLYRKREAWAKRDEN